MRGRDWLGARAKAVRAAMTPQEKAVWRVLHEGELAALNWRRQAVMGAYILDFVSHAARIVVEIDGAQHAEPEQAAHDARRTAWLGTQGYRVLRIWNHDALAEQDGVWRTVFAAACKTPARRRMERWREQHDAGVLKANACLPLDGGDSRASTTRKVQTLASPSMGEATREAGGGGERTSAPEVTEAPSSSCAAPPQSSLRDDSSPIEGEPGASIGARA